MLFGSYSVHERLSMCIHTDHRVVDLPLYFVEYTSWWNRHNFSHRDMGDDRANEEPKSNEEGTRRS